MLAVIQTGGKQYKVSEGDEIRVEKLPGNVGDIIKLDKVLMAGEDNSMEVGGPFLDGMEVTGEILSQAKAKKIIVFKFKRRKKYRKKQGHRQNYTQLKITGIGKAAANDAEETPAAVNG